MKFVVVVAFLYLKGTHRWSPMYPGLVVLSLKCLRHSCASFLPMPWSYVQPHHCFVKRFWGCQSYPWRQTCLFHSALHIPWNQRYSVVDDLTGCRQGPPPPHTHTPSYSHAFAQSGSLTGTRFLPHILTGHGCGE